MERLPGDGGASQRIHLLARGLFRSIPTVFHPRAALETRGGPTMGKRRKGELELGGYLLEDLVKVHPRSRSLRSVDTESCHTRVI